MISQPPARRHGSLGDGAGDDLEGSFAMLILGLLLVIIAVALTVGAVYDGGEPAVVELLGYDLSTTVAGVFFVGMATTAVLLLGLWLMRSSFGRARRRREERKEAKLRQRESVSRLEQERAELRAENERLAQKLERERATSAGAATGATSAGGRGHHPDLETQREDARGTGGTSDRHSSSHTTTSGSPAAGERDAGAGRSTTEGRHSK